MHWCTNLWICGIIISWFVQFTCSAPFDIKSNKTGWNVTLHVSEHWINILIAFGIYEVLMFLLWLCAKARESKTEDEESNDETETCCCFCCKFKFVSGVELFMCFHIKFLIGVGQFVNTVVSTCCQSCCAAKLDGKSGVKYELVDRKKGKR